MSESAVAKLLEALRELTPSNEATPVWRELGAEARVRGLARRTFREWCQRMGVAIRDVGGIAYVSPPEVDRVIAQGPVRPTPPSLTPQGDTERRYRFAAATLLARVEDYCARSGCDPWCGFEHLRALTSA